MNLLLNYGVPLEVKSSFTEGEGSLVTHEDAEMERVSVSGVTGDRNQAKITVVGVPDSPGIAAKLFGAVCRCGHHCRHDYSKCQPGGTDGHFPLRSPKGICLKP